MKIIIICRPGQKPINGPQAEIVLSPKNNVYPSSRVPDTEREKTPKSVPRSWGNTTAHENKVIQSLL